MLLTLLQIQQQELSRNPHLNEYNPSGSQELLKLVSQHRKWLVSTHRLAFGNLNIPTT